MCIYIYTYMYGSMYIYIYMYIQRCEVMEYHWEICSLSCRMGYGSKESDEMFEVRKRLHENEYSSAKTMKRAFYQ